MDWGTVLVAVLTALSGASVASLVTGLLNRPKNRAETEAMIAQTGKTLDERYRAFIDEVEERLTQVNSELAQVKAELKSERKVSRRLIAYARQLRAEVIRLGGIVPPLPPEIEGYLLVPPTDD